MLYRCSVWQQYSCENYLWLWYWERMSCSCIVPRCSLPGNSNCFWRTSWCSEFILSF